jgi:uncharacterized membrane protein
MKLLLIFGFIILVLGILSFFVPIRHTEHHGINAGDVQFGVDTQHSELLPPYVGVILVVVGGGLVIAGRRSGN